MGSDDMLLRLSEFQLYLVGFCGKRLFDTQYNNSVTRNQNLLITVNKTRKYLEALLTLHIFQFNVYVYMYVIAMHKFVYQLLSIGMVTIVKYEQRIKIK